MHLLRKGIVALAVGTVVVAGATAAYAGTITSPTGNPFVVPGDATGNPVPFTVTASGYTAGSLVFVEQCDGVAPTTPGWSPSADCDLGSSPSPAIADGSGAVTFSASDPNFAFPVFKGESPQGLFNCLSPNGPALTPTDGVPDFRNCQMRVSTNNTVTTADQVFLSMQLPEAAAGATVIGRCTDAVALLKLKPSLTDQTQVGVKIAGNLAKDQTTKAAVNGGGSCSGAIRPGDPHVPQPPASLTAKSESVSLLGNTSCASGAAATAADATAALAYPITGKITWTFNQTYTDLLTAAVKPFKMQAQITLIGFSPTAADVVDVAGSVLSGVNPGAHVSGSLWQDPVTLTKGATGYNTGYELDIASAVGCGDGTPNNANIATTLSGGGAGTPSLLGSSASGLTFTLG